MDLNKLCLGCITQKDDAGKCPRCGYDNNEAPKLLQYIKPGSILNGKFLVGKALGHGGFGVTYIGFDLNLELKVAIKEYLPQTLATRTNNETILTIYPGEKGQQFKDGLKKFLDEAKTVAKFNQHKNIVTVRDFFSENGTAYMVMDYIEGMDLKDYVMKQNRPLQFNEALNLLNPIMDALQTVHNSGLLHRDVSPDNIFITDNGTPILIDFGAAREYMDQDSGMSVILKPGYAPEEQYRKSGNSGPWSDIYAFAATFYHVISGKKPVDSLDRLANDSISSPSVLGVQIPHKSEVALMKALAVKSKDRYQSMTDFQKDINTGNVGFVQGDAKTVSGVYNWGSPNTNQQMSGDFSQVHTGTSNNNKASIIKTALIVGGSVVGIAIIALALFGIFSKSDQTEKAKEQESVDTNTEVALTLETTPEPTPTPTPEPTQEPTPTPAQEDTKLEEQTEMDDNTPVDFVDSAFEKMLRVALKKPTGVITQSELNSIESLEIIGDKYVSINDDVDYSLEYYSEKGYCVDGREYVSRGEIKRVDDLAKLANLSDVFIGYNSIANLDGVSDCYNLVDIYLPYNDITDISPIYQASKLELAMFSKEDLLGIDENNTSVDVYYMDFLVSENAFRMDTMLDTAAGHTLGVLSDGSVVVQGTKTNNNKTEVGDWDNIIQVAGGEDHSVGLKIDGTCVATGSNKTYGQCNVNAWVDIKYIAAGQQHTIGVKIDGTCVATGLNDKGQCDVEDWTDIVQVACGAKHTLGLKSDGTVVATGLNASGRCNVQDWQGIVFIAAGEKHSLGLRVDGTVVGVGWNERTQLDYIKRWKNIVSISAGSIYSVAVDSDGKVYLSGSLSKKLPEHKGARYIYGSNDSVIVLNKDGSFKGYGANSYGKNSISSWSDMGLMY